MQLMRLSVLVIIGLFVSQPLHAVEEAVYTLVRKDGKIEIRDYEEKVLVETTVESSFSRAGSKAFRKLFRYISGANVAEQKIAMTAPVLSHEAQVNDRETDGKTWIYAFVLPADFNFENSPTPTDISVRLRREDAYRAAVIRYSGSFNEKNVRKKIKELENWMTKEGVIAVGEPRIAGYNTPWTLPFLKRNEIIVPIRN